MNFLMKEFSPSSCRFLSHGSKYSIGHFFLTYLSLCYCPIVTDQVSHPDKTKGKILVIVLFGRSRGNEHSELEGNFDAVASWMQTYACVTLLTCIGNTAGFSDLFVVFSSLSKGMGRKKGDSCLPCYSSHF
jgi:hypothetical protein